MRCERQVAAAGGRWGTPQGCAHVKSGFDFPIRTRKYRLNLTLAHQYLEQLDPWLRSAILGNVGTLLTFRTGTEDAEYLAREFYPVFKEEDFVNLPQYHVYLKLLIDGVPSQGFGAVTLPLLGRPSGNKERVIALSQERYGRPSPAGRD